MTRTLSRLSFLSVLLLFLFYLLSSTAEVIDILSGRLPGGVAPPVVPGAWLHGDSDAHDAAFFADEDAAHRRWQSEQNKQKQKQRRAEQDKDKNKNKDKDKDKDKEQQQGQRRRTASAGAELSAAAVKARTAARRARLRELRNASDTSPTAARQFIDAEAAQLSERLDALALADNSSDAYLRLLPAAFGRMSVFSPDIIMNGEAIPPAETELRAIATDARSFGANTTELNATLSRVSGRLLRSRRAHVMAAALAGPLLLPARARLATTLQEIDAQIRANDEATDSARQALRESLQRRRRLRDADAFVAALSRAVRNAQRSHSYGHSYSESYSGVLLRGEDFVAALTAAARLRGCAAAALTAAALTAAAPGAEGLSPQPLEAATAATGAEIAALLLRPAAAATVVAAAGTWALRALRSCVLRRARRGSQRRITRVALCGIVLAEALVPYVLPAVAVVLANLAVEVTLLDILRIGQPLQFITLGAIIGVTFLGCCGAAWLAGRLFAWASGEDLQRKKKL